jgi:hypothetical protein
LRPVAPRPGARCKPATHEVASLTIRRDGSPDRSSRLGFANRQGGCYGTRRVVTFDGVSKDRIEEMKREMTQGDQPEGLDATEIIVLHGREMEMSQAILF